jgi:glutaredoxin-like protein
MAVLSDDVLAQVRQRFSERLVEPVDAKLYIKPGSSRLILPAGVGCATCAETREMLEAIAAEAGERIRLEIVDVTQEDPLEEVLDVPFLTLGRDTDDRRIRFLGLPAGFEFAMVIEAIERVSAGSFDLAPETVDAVSELEDDIEILVFATPTCRYCPAAVTLANQLALASPRITAITVSAGEFPRLATAFGVQGVPRTVVNRRGAFVGALPEPAFVDAVLQLAGVREVASEQPAEGASTAL